MAARLGKGIGRREIAQIARERFAKLLHRPFQAGLRALAPLEAPLQVDAVRLRAACGGLTKPSLLLLGKRDLQGPRKVHRNSALQAREFGCVALIYSAPNLRVARHVDQIDLYPEAAISLRDARRHHRRHVELAAGALRICDVPL